MIKVEKLSIQEVKTLWFRDRAYLLKQPSIDRIDGNGDYVFTNCRFIEMEDNRKRQPVAQILDTKVIAIYKSAGEGARKIKGVVQGICQVANKEPHHNTYRGYIWRWI